MKASERTQARPSPSLGRVFFFIQVAAMPRTLFLVPAVKDARRQC
jgi:hypothetical protein